MQPEVANTIVNKGLNHHHLRNRFKRAEKRKVLKALVHFSGKKERAFLEYQMILIPSYDFLRKVVRPYIKFWLRVGVVAPSYSSRYLSLSDYFLYYPWHFLAS